MKGSYYQNPSSGTHYARLDLPRGSDGRRRQLRLKSSSRRDLERQVAEAIVKLNRGEVSGASRMTMGELYEHFLAAKTRLKFRTLGAYTDQIRLYLIPRFGHLQVRKVSRAMVQLAVDDWWRDPRLDGKPGLRSARTVCVTLRVLSMIFDFAMRMEIRGDNPAARILRPKIQPPAEPNVEPERLTALLHAARRDDFEFPIVLLLVTGLRRGEFTALTWGDWNASLRRFQITRALECRGRQVIVGTPKSPKSRREIYVGEETVVAIEAYRIEQSRRLDMLGLRQVSDTPIIDLLGRPWNPDAFGARYRRVLKRAGLPPLKLHGTRHAYTTLAVLGGAPTRVVSDLLGHVDTDLVNRVYMHVTSGPKRQAGEAVSLAVEALRGSGGEHEDMRAK